MIDTQKKKPIVNFTAEPGLRVYFDHSDGTTTPAFFKQIHNRSRISKSRIWFEALYTVVSSDITAMAIKVVKDGNDLTSQQISDAGLSKIKGKIY